MYPSAIALARKLILHAPVSDERLIKPFVERALRDNVALIAIVGQGCVHLEDIIDDVIVGEGSAPGRFICTTSHPGEPFADVLNLARHWGSDPVEAVEEIHLHAVTAKLCARSHIEQRRTANFFAAVHAKPSPRLWNEAQKNSRARLLSSGFLLQVSPPSHLGDTRRGE